MTSRGIGSIDTSSGGAAASSIFSFKGVGKNGPQKPAVLPVAPAFEKQKTRDTYAPPPRRAAAPAPPPPEPEPEVEEEEEEEAQGEWVEALYDLVAAVSVGRSGLSSY